MVSDRVWITDGVLTRAELNRLYDAATFYVCTSHAEGQNLPLLEAMARGVVPVTVDHTAMSDYISDNDAVVIPSRTRPLDIRLAARYRMYGVETNYVDADDVSSALQRAEDMNDDA
ncbi:glycosyltransferase family 4 protein, partial [Desulfobulbus alkaliphilus]|uniref:glycosyltransferase family 4 protein n=1 Tax=Desulfobulbus alkaliphilus TaxID=869814 RepID=UPI001962E7AD